LPLLPFSFAPSRFSLLPGHCIAAHRSRVWATGRAKQVWVLAEPAGSEMNITRGAAGEASQAHSHHADRAVEIGFDRRPVSHPQQHLARLRGMAVRAPPSPPSRHLLAAFQPHASLSRVAALHSAGKEHQRSRDPREERNDVRCPGTKLGSRALSSGRLRFVLAWHWSFCSAMWR